MLIIWVLFYKLEVDVWVCRIKDEWCELVFDGLRLAYCSVKNMLPVNTVQSSWGAQSPDLRKG